MNNPDQYWDLLEQGRSGIVAVPAQRWDAEAFYTDDHTVPGTICNREGGFLTGWQPDEFDAEFFAISPREAAAIDPQQRLLLEVAHEALEDAGIPTRSIAATNAAVIVGLSACDYLLTLASAIAPQDLDAYILTGNAANFAAGAGCVSARHARPDIGRRHSGLVVADGDPSGLSEPALR